MSPIALLAILGAASGFAALDALRKHLVPALGPAGLIVLLAAAPAPLFALLWVASGAELPGAGYWRPAGILLASNLASNLLFARAVEVAPLSRTVPLLSLTPVFTALLAMPLLGEVPTEQQWLGIGVVVLGAFALSSAGHGRLTVGRGALYMVGVAAIWSLNGPLDKLALRDASIGWHALFQSVGVSLLSLAVLALRGEVARLRAVRGHGRAVVGVALAATVAIGLQLIALQMTLAALVEVVKRAVGLVAALALGRALFGERVTRQHWAAAALMGAGITLVLL